jgi:hypothetical protein
MPCDLIKSSKQLQRQIPVYVNFFDAKQIMHEYGPIYLPSIPRQGEILEGEWMRRPYQHFEVVRVFHCRRCKILCKEPHIYLYLDRLTFGQRPRDEDLRDELRRGMEKIKAVEGLLKTVLDLLLPAKLLPPRQDRQGSPDRYSGRR